MWYITDMTMRQLYAIWYIFQTCLLDILDTAGQEEYSAMRERYTLKSDCIVVIYSITNRHSFSEAKSLHQFLNTLQDADGVDDRPVVSSIFLWTIFCQC